VCKNLIGKHSKVVKVIQLKRAAMANVKIDSIEAAMESEELEELERIELEWRPTPDAQSCEPGDHRV
jgi:hypothetical protein